MSPAARSSSAAALVLALSLAGCGGGGAGGNAGSAKPIEIELQTQNESGQTGTATINSVEGGQLNVVVVMVSSVTEENVQPVHIHKGTCEETDEAVAFELFDAVVGIGAGTIDADIDTLTETGHVIEVHESAEVDTVVACGAITR